MAPFLFLHHYMDATDLLCDLKKKSHAKTSKSYYGVKKDLDGDTWLKKSAKIITPKSKNRGLA